MGAASLLSLVLGTAGAGTWFSASRRAAEAERRHPPEGEFVEVGGTRVHAVIQGKGPDLVLLHGAFGSLRDFTFALTDRLAKRYRVIAFDRPGHGFTDPLGRGFLRTRDSPADQAALLAEAARKLGARRPVVAGHSYGGAVALAWALDQDPAALVLFAGVSMPWPGRLGKIYEVSGSQLGGALAAPLISAWTPHSILREASDRTFTPQEAPEGYGAHIGPYMPVRLGALRATTRQVKTLRPQIVAMERRYDRLTLPIELIHGAADATVPLEIHALPFSKKVASARLRVLDGIGHMPHHADPEAAVAAIDRAAARAGLTRR